MAQTKPEKVYFLYMLRLTKTFLEWKNAGLGWRKWFNSIFIVPNWNSDKLKSLRIFTDILQHVMFSKMQ